MARLYRLVVVAPFDRFLPGLRRRRIPVRSFALSTMCPVLGVRPALVFALVLCGQTVAAETVQTRPSAADPQHRRNIHAQPLPATSVDNQTSWIIEPDVPRIPSIAGLKPQLPPHVERRLSYAFDLAQRGATYSASAEFRAVLSLCALELDARDGGTSRRAALQQAWRALDEADEFNGQRSELWDAEDVRSVAALHDTPVLNHAAAPATARARPMSSPRAITAT